MHISVEAGVSPNSQGTIMRGTRRRAVGITARAATETTNVTRKLSGLCVLIALGTLATTGPAYADYTVDYTGQGFNYDGTTFNLNDERCGLTGQNDADDGSTGQFADWNGPGQPYQEGQPYLVWVLTVRGATMATLYLPNGPVDMYQVGGTFKYASEYFSYEDLTGPSVHAVHNGTARGNPQLVVSHGCKPFETEGAWCSPGYWKNAQDPAWALTGYAKTDLFNNTVVPNFYDTASGADPTLIQVLTTPGANTFGGPSGPYDPPLNAFNATGAFLTDQIPGFHFDRDLVGVDEACPIDNHGNFKD